MFVFLHLFLFVHVFFVGLTESPEMSLDETILIAEIREQIRKQIGVVYPTD